MHEFCKGSTQRRLTSCQTRASCSQIFVVKAAKPLPDGAETISHPPAPVTSMVGQLVHRTAALAAQRARDPRAGGHDLNASVSLRQRVLADRDLRCQLHALFEGLCAD